MKLFALVLACMSLLDVDQVNAIGKIKCSCTCFPREPDSDRQVCRLTDGEPGSALMTTRTDCDSKRCSIIEAKEMQ